MRLHSLSIILLALGSVSGAFAQAKVKDPIQNAIANGAKFLKSSYDPQKNGPPGQGIPDGPPIAKLMGIGEIMNETGPACLAGLAMLEAGYPVTDPSIKNIAAHVRQVALSQKGTYQISLCIMFLDRLGNKVDTPIIQILTLRLMAGQGADGTWSYLCSGFDLDDVQIRQILGLLGKEAKLVTDPKTPAPKKGPMATPREDLDQTPKTPKKEEPPKEKEKPPEPVKGLHPEVEKLMKLINNRTGRGAGGDHSNTQFATVGLWCGRRHHVDVSDALKATDKHYRDIQQSDGGWGYVGGGGGSSPTMTCAGLMGAAMGFGAKNVGGGGGEIGQDKAIEAALKYLGNVVKAASEDVERDTRGNRVRFNANDLSNNYYFLWSLERVGMTYGLTTLGKVDWYAWGAELLLASQTVNGSWENGNYHSSTPVVNTAFAVLFLSRANLAQDLSTSLKGKVKDPGTSRLVGGGDLSKLIGAPSGSGSNGGNNTRPTPMPPPIPPVPSKDKPPTTPTVPANDFDGKVAKLLRELMNADGDTRNELLKAYRDAKGGEYTETLAQAALKLTGDAQGSTRDALANRLTRMNSNTLVTFMGDRNREIRRAAALACGSKDKTRLPEFADALIKTLADDEPTVVQAARASLKTLSGQDHGPDTSASAADRSKAILAWRQWWTTQKR